MRTAVWITALRRLMASKGWTQTDLADRSGIRPNTISDILNPDEPSSPRLDTMVALAQAFGVPLWALFCDDREAVLFTEQMRHAITADEHLLDEIAARVLMKLNADARPGRAKTGRRRTAS